MHRANFLNRSILCKALGSRFVQTVVRITMIADHILSYPFVEFEHISRFIMSFFQHAVSPVGIVWLKKKARCPRCVFFGQCSNYRAKFFWNSSSTTTTFIKKIFVSFGFHRNITVDKNDYCNDEAPTLCILHCDIHLLVSQTTLATRNFFLFIGWSTNVAISFSQKHLVDVNDNNCLATHGGAMAKLAAADCGRQSPGFYYSITYAFYFLLNLFVVTLSILLWSGDLVEDKANEFLYANLCMLFALWFCMRIGSWLLQYHSDAAVEIRKHWRNVGRPRFHFFVRRLAVCFVMANNILFQFGLLHRGNEGQNEIRDRSKAN